MIYSLMRICLHVELQVHHLAVNALLKSSHLNELNGGLLLGLNSENPQDIAVPGQMSLDESISCAPAFRVLKQLVQGWLSDAVSSGNTFADALLQHLYRWLCRLVFDLRLIYCTNLQLNGTFCQELVPYDFLLVVMHIISLISFHLWCMLGGRV